MDQAAISRIAEEVRPHLKTDRLRLDQAATEDVVRIVAAVLEDEKRAARERT